MAKCDSHGSRNACAGGRGSQGYSDWFSRLVGDYPTTIVFTAACAVVLCLATVLNVMLNLRKDEVE